jgi:hypothetical protein
MYSILNCRKVAKKTPSFTWDSYGSMWLKLVTHGVSKRALQWYSKHYCVMSVTKTFTLKGIKTIHRSTLWTVFSKATALTGTNVRARVFNARLLAISQFASRRSCDRPTWSRSSVTFLGPRANAKLASKFHVAQHASHAALPMVTLRILP